MISEYSGIDPTDVAAVNLDNTFAGFVYWIDYDSDLIQRSSLVGTNVETLVDLKASFGGGDGDYVPRYLDIDPAGGKMYWTDAAGGVIRRANLNGSNVETVVSGFTGGGLRGIAIDSAAGKMYWADSAAQKIQRANLDGSGVQDLITSSASGVRETSWIRRPARCTGPISTSTRFAVRTWTARTSKLCGPARRIRPTGWNRPGYQWRTRCTGPTTAATKSCGPISMARASKH